MTTLSNISIGILTKLEEEAGSNDYWTSTEVKSWFNDLYTDICRENNVIAQRTITTDSVADQQDYSLTSGHLSLLGVTYNGKPLHPTTLSELDAYSETWRGRGSGTPKWYFFEEGQQYTYVSLFPKPDTDSVEIGLTESYLPSTLGDDDEPAEPFKDGLIIRDGVLSLALAKEGEGQNIERSEFYWDMFAIKLRRAIVRQPAPKRVHVLRSIEDVGAGGLNLGEHYPPYSFD